MDSVVKLRVQEQVLGVLTGRGVLAGLAHPPVAEPGHSGRAWRVRRFFEGTARDPKRALLSRTGITAISRLLDPSPLNSHRKPSILVAARREKTHQRILLALRRIRKS